MNIDTKSPEICQAENRPPPSQLSFDFLEPFHYLKPGSPGYFSLLQKQDSGMVQRSYRIAFLPDVLRSVDRHRDTYLTPNQFYKKNRRLVSLLQLNAGFVDLDTYRTEPYGDVSPESAAQSLLDTCDREGWPEPSIIVFSGRGLQIKWLLDPPVPAMGVPRWNATEVFLSKQFRPFGADPCCLSASSALRLERTVNTKSGEVVRVLYPAPGQEPQTYDFNDLAGRVLPYTREEWHQRKKVAKEKGKRREPTPFTIQSLNYSRLLDLRKLATLRGWTDGNPDGQRDLPLFFAATFLSWLVEPGLPLWLEIAELAREWCPTWPERKVREHVCTVLRMAEHGKHYRLRNQTLIDRLEITPMEETNLKTIISESERQRRFTERRRTMGELDRETYQARAKERKEKALELAKNGLNFKDIAKELNCSLMHIYRLLTHF